MMLSFIHKNTLLINRLAAAFGLLRFPLPDLGEKIKEGRVKKLYVREGDRVEEFGKLADVQSDKQFTQITSPEQGIIKKLYYREEESCQVGDIFLEMETNAPETNKQPVKVDEKEKKTQSEHTQEHDIHHDEFLASATVKMHAREHKINLKEVKGTGRKGRILKEDIIHFVQHREKTKGELVKQIKKQHKSVKQQNETVTRVTMGSEEQQLQNIVNYSNSIPHLYYQETFDVTELQQIIHKSKNKQPKFTLLSILLKTFSLAIKSYPRMNSTYNVHDPFNFKVHPNHNILFPIYGQNGVVFNTIRNAETLNIHQIENTLNYTQKSGLNLQQLSFGTICVSHIGSIGAISMNPLIYGEIACHASIGSLREVPVYQSGQLSKRQVVDVTMGCDHRVLDGATVARFTALWRDYSESPTLALLSMV